jgi:hypothetical protein
MDYELRKSAERKDYKKRTLAEHLSLLKWRKNSKTKTDT